MADFRRPLLRLLGTMTALLGLWQGAVYLCQPAPWLLPAPAAVWVRAYALHASGSLWQHIGVTLLEAGAGFLIGSSIGFILGYLLFLLPWLERAFTPVLVAANAVPAVAFAPLLLLWFGSGQLTKGFVAAAMVILPLALNTLHGFRSVRGEHRRLFAALGAGPWQTFSLLEWPSAWPSILTGARISAPLAVVGAVVGEFLGSSAGLGFLVMDAGARMDTAQLFVALLGLSLMGWGFHGSLSLLSRRLPAHMEIVDTLAHPHRPVE
jgi:NitT/TauT family transport system permease protein